MASLPQAHAPKAPDRQTYTSDDAGLDNALLKRLNGVRLIVIILIAIGYASTMAVGPQAKEWLHFLGHDPSWYGIQVLFFISGWLAWRSLTSGRGIKAFIRTRAMRTLPWVAMYTFVVAAILYPILCDHDAPAIKGTLDLTLYFVKTVTLIDPGGPMPGALDHALYACLLQGTIWTLRWGVIAYVGLICLSWLRPGPRSLSVLFVLCIMVHIAVGSWSLQTGSDVFRPMLPGLRLGYAFLGGVWIRSMEPSLNLRWKGWLLTSLICLGLAAAHYYAITWTHMIEVMASLGLCALAMALLRSPFSVLTGWPNLTLPAYLGIWPVAQLVVYLDPTVAVAIVVMTTLAAILSLALILRLAGDRLFRPRHRRVQTA